MLDKEREMVRKFMSLFDRGISVIAIEELCKEQAQVQKVINQWKLHNVDLADFFKEMDGSNIASRVDKVFMGL